MTISSLFNPNYYQSPCVISERLTQQMAIFQPVTPHLLSPLSPSTSQHYYAPLPRPPRLTPLSCPSSYVTPSLRPAAAALLGPANSVDINFTLPVFIVSVAVCASWGTQSPELNLCSGCSSLPLAVYSCRTVFSASVPCKSGTRAICIYFFLRWRTLCWDVS